MPTPKEQIRAGVDAAIPATNYSTADRIGLVRPRLSHLVGKRTDPKSLKVLRNTIAKHLTRVHELRGKTVSDIAQKTTEIRAHYDAEGYAEGEREGTRTDILTQPRRKMLTDRAILKMKKKVVANVATEIDVLLRKLNTAKEEIASVRLAWQDPVSVLARLTIDSADRERYMANMANAGPVELRVYAEEAIREGNMAKGAAVLARIDRLTGETKKNLTFTKLDIAEALIETEWNSAVEDLELSEFAILLASFEGREALGMKLNAADTTKLGLEQKRVERVLGRQIGQVGDFDFMASLDPVKKPTPKKDEYSGDPERRIKDMDRFRELFKLDERTDVEHAELVRLGNKLDLFED